MKLGEFVGHLDGKDGLDLEFTVSGRRISGSCHITEIKSARIESVDCGRKHAGEIRGVTFVITIVGAALGPLPFGWAAAHGGYFPVLAAGGALCAIAIVANLVVDRPAAG